MNIGNIGIAGEFRCVVTDEQGAIVTDTGYQKNLILNQGLEFFGGEKGYYFNSDCVVGAGSSTPSVTQNTLDSVIAISTSRSDKVVDYSYTDTGDGLYKIWEQNKYRFEGLGSVNISEVGLVSQGNTIADYYLTTRALVKDIQGNPTTITVRDGEVLDIYYKIHKVVEIADKDFVVNVADGDGGGVSYNIKLRPSNIGKGAWENPSKAINDLYQGTVYVSENDVAAATSAPSGSRVVRVATLENYIPDSFKRVMNISFGLNDANINLRSVFASSSSKFSTELLPFQMRFGRVSDDAPLVKTNKDTLTISLEFSWGRYEGAL